MHFTSVFQYKFRLSSCASKSKNNRKMAIEGVLLVPTIFLPVILTVTILLLIHYWQINLRSYKLALQIPGPSVIQKKS